MSIIHRTEAELLGGLEEVRQSPGDMGRLELIVRRPQVNEREVLEKGVLDREEGLVGDSWKIRGSSRSADGSSRRDMQLTLMNSRVIALIAQRRDRWGLAGDQLFVDLDLSSENLPPGTRLAIGPAVIEVTHQPHTGCKKFVTRYGMAAMKFINSPPGRLLNLRGIYACVVEPGTIHTGDVVQKIPL